MTWQPLTGDLQMVMHAISEVASSDAFAAEVTAYKQLLVAPGAPSFQIHDATGQSYTLSTAEADFPTLDWIGTAFNEIVMNEGLRPRTPYPRLHLIGGAGRNQSESGHDFLEVDYQGLIYQLDAVAIASNERPDYSLRESLILIRCLRTLLRRNQQLGGLVEEVVADGPEHPGGSNKVANQGVLTASMQRFQIKALAFP